MARFVLVHGAFAGGWIWGPLAERLEAAGHRSRRRTCRAPATTTTPLEEVTLDLYAERVCEILDESPEHVDPGRQQHGRHRDLRGRRPPPRAGRGA